jgi:hypothetical protein
MPICRSKTALAFEADADGSCDETQTPVSKKSASVQGNRTRGILQIPEKFVDEVPRD